MSYQSRREGDKMPPYLLVGSAVAAVLSAGASAAWGTGWMGQPVEIPVGWLLIGALVLTFVPTLSLVAVVQRRLGVNVEIEGTE